jgi:hypothetical protein
MPILKPIDKPIDKPIHDADSRPATLTGVKVCRSPVDAQDAELAMPCQQWFHLRWGSLRDPHVRSLAWLLDSPDLLDPAAPQWGGRIASLGPDAASEASDWLHALDASPSALHAFLNLRPHARLGRYAEKLLAYYFTWRGTLVAHGLQVRAGKRDTIGEFDYLLRDEEPGVEFATSDGKDAEKDGVWHWEFATKFYLLRGDPDAIRDSADYFVGPNLADTLGAKMEKILDRQLALSRHPAARELLQEAHGLEVGEAGIDVAQALVKGWLFYPLDEAPALRRERLMGVSAGHCRGFWCTLTQLREAEPAKALGVYLLLPRLEWMPPALALSASACDLSSLALLVEAEFTRDNMPVLVAELAPDEVEIGLLREVRRGFVVPDDWSYRAGLRKPR